MKKSDHDIDKLFESHFEDFQAPVLDKDGLWSRINPDKTNRRFMLFIFFGFIGASSLLLAWTVDELEYNQAAAGGGSSDESSYAIFDKDTNQQHSNDLIAILDEVDGVDVQTEKYVKESAQLIKTNFIKSNVTSKLTNKSQTSIIHKDFKEQDYIDHSTLVTNKVHPKTSITNIGKSEVDNVNVSVLPQHFEISEKSNIKKSDRRLRSLVSVPERIPSLAINSLYNKYGLSDELSMNKLVCSTKRRGGGAGGGHLFVDAYAHLGLPIDHVSLRAGSEEEVDYLDLWNDRYQSLSSFSGGLMVGYSMNNGLDISAGGEYQRIESQYQTTQRVTEIITVYDPMAFFFTDDNGDVVWVADSVSAVSVFDRTTSIANNTTLLNIPFQLSYPIFQRGSWQVRALAGGSFNFSIDHRGQFLRSDNRLVLLDDSSSATYMTSKLGLSLEAGLQLSTLIGDRLECYASPRYRYSRQSYLASTASLSVARDFIGLRVGVRYHLD